MSPIRTTISASTVALELRSGKSRRAVSKALAWISGPDMYPPPADAALTSSTDDVVAPTTTILSRSRARSWPSYTRETETVSIVPGEPA
jgi:hypothetical protein